jgi:hypothetical protein
MHNTVKPVRHPGTQLTCTLYACKAHRTSTAGSVDRSVRSSSISSQSHRQVATWCSQTYESLKCTGSHPLPQTGSTPGWAAQRTTAAAAACLPCRPTPQLLSLGLAHQRLQRCTRNFAEQARRGHTEPAVTWLCQGSAFICSPVASLLFVTGVSCSIS